LKFLPQGTTRRLGDYPDDYPASAMLSKEVTGSSLTGNRIREENAFRAAPQGKLPSSISCLRIFGLRLHTYRFIYNEMIRMKRLIETLYQMVNRFMSGSFRCNRLVAIIVSKKMKRYLDEQKFPLYYNDMFISQL
jgi:hypothetical protein